MGSKTNKCAAGAAEADCDSGVGAARSLAPFDLFLQGMDGWRIGDFNRRGSACLGELLYKVDDLDLFGF